MYINTEDRNNKKYIQELSFFVMWFEPVALPTATFLNLFQHVIFQKPLSESHDTIET